MPKPAHSAIPADILAARDAAECLFDAAAVARAVDQLAVRLAVRLDGAHPIVMCVMNGGVILTAELLLRLHFPLEVSYVHATRYRDATHGAVLEWRAPPSVDVAGRTVLLVDDVLDEGHTLAAVVREAARVGRRERSSPRVLVDKDIGRPRPVRVDEAALRCPDRFLFGHGMDYRGHWRNLAGIYALPAGWSRAVTESVIGIIGGTGLNQLASATRPADRIDTPYGAGVSDAADRPDRREDGDFPARATDSRIASRRT